MSDGRVWHVRSYPTGTVLYTADTYDAARQWRQLNEMASVIIPERWPGRLLRACKDSSNDEVPTREAIGILVSAIGAVLTIAVGLPAAIIAGTIHSPTSLAWGLPILVVPMLMVVGGLIFVPPGPRHPDQ